MLSYFAKHKKNKKKSFKKRFFCETNKLCEKIHNKNEINVNGPVNSFRMEGEVNGKKKVLYLFADIHSNPNTQTQCNSIYSLEFKDYLMKNIDENIKYDLFVEIQPDYILSQINQKKGNYLLSLRYFFKKCFNYDEYKNKVYDSKLFPNVRFHYMDVRQLISLEPFLFYDSGNLYVEFMKDVGGSFTLNDVKCDSYIRKCKYHLDNLNNIYEILYSDNQSRFSNNKVNIIKTSFDYQYDHSVASTILKKTYDANDEKLKIQFQNLKNNYVSKQIKKNIQSFQKIIDLFFEYKQQNCKITQHGTRDYLTKCVTIISDISKELGTCHSEYQDTGVTLTDLYFLRRFLDKTYINNGIIYSGYAHTIDYIYLLIKYFDFKITHSAYEVVNLEETTQFIKKTDENYDFLNLHDIFLPQRKYGFYQCSNLTNFPKNFL